MGELNLSEVNRFLTLVGLEQVDADRVRVVPDTDERRYVKGPPNRLIGTEPRSEYLLSETPDLARAVRPFHRTAASLCLPRMAEGTCRRELLRAMRDEMQSPESGKAASRGRILATTFYWALAKAVPLTALQAREEASALAGQIASHLESSPVSQEIRRNAGLAARVLIETRPAAERPALEALFSRP